MQFLEQILRYDGNALCLPIRPNISIMNESAIRQAAVQMMKLHGREAELAAARQADAMLSRGNVGGFHTWTRIATLINDLERKPDV